MKNKLKDLQVDNKATLKSIPFEKEKVHSAFIVLLDISSGNDFRGCCITPPEDPSWINHSDLFVAIFEQHRAILTKPRHCQESLILLWILFLSYLLLVSRRKCPLDLDLWYCWLFLSIITCCYWKTAGLMTTVEENNEEYVDRPYVMSYNFWMY